MLQSRFPRHSLSRSTERFREPLGAQKSPGTARRDGLCCPRGRAARDVLRYRQRGACRGGYPGREIRRSLAYTHRALSKPPVVRLAGNDLCQAQRTDPPRGGIYYHPPSWGSHAQADPGIAGSTVALLPSYPGQGKTSLGKVCGSDRDLGRIPRRVAADRLRRPGTESPTFVLTNDLPQRLTARQVIQTYACPNHVEHSLGEKITFFHLDCLASEVRLNVDFDLTLTVVAAMLYQRLAARLKGFAEATPQTLFRKFVNTPGRIEITQEEVVVYFEKRSHNPILKEAGFDKITAPVPWLNNKPVRLHFP